MLTQTDLEADNHDGEWLKMNNETFFRSGQIGLFYPILQRIIGRPKNQGVVHRIGGDKGGS